MQTLIERHHQQLRDARRRAAARSSRGMTLIEIMVVVAIISLVLGGVGLVAFNQFQEARLSTAKKDTVQIQESIEAYMLQKRGKCPKSLQEVKAAGVIARVIKDPWGNEYEIKCPGDKTSVDVVSGGPDGQIGGEDDIANYQGEGDGDEDLQE